MSMNTTATLRPSPLSFDIRSISTLKREISRMLEVYVIDKLFFGRIEKQFYQTLGGHILFETLFAAVEFDLFNLLDSHSSLNAKQIAHHLKLSEQSTKILLLGLTTTGFLKLRYGRYQNSMMSKRYLLDRSPWKYTACVKWQHYINYKPLFKFYDSLKAGKNLGLNEISGTGSTLYERLAENPELEALFQEAMQEISQQSNPLLPKYLDLRNVKHIVDIGGGNGTNIIALAKRFPHLAASVFDSPTVCDIAEENFTKQDCQKRLSAIRGDIFKDKLPENIDCFLFCHFFTIWSQEENLELLKKTYAALPKGGRTVIFNMMQNNKRNGPLTSAIGSPYFLTLATGTGMLYAWSEYETLFKEAGFSEVITHRLPRDHGLIIGIK